MEEFSIELGAKLKLDSLQEQINKASSNLKPLEIKIDTEKLDNTTLSQNKQYNNKNISIQKDFSDLFDNNKIYTSINSKIAHLVSMNKYNKLKLDKFELNILQNKKIFSSYPSDINQSKIIKIKKNKKIKIINKISKEYKTKFSY